MMPFEKWWMRLKWVQSQVKVPSRDMRKLLIAFLLSLSWWDLVVPWFHRTKRERELSLTKSQSWRNGSRSWKMRFMTKLSKLKQPYWTWNRYEIAYNVETPRSSLSWVGLPLWRPNEMVCFMSSSTLNWGNPPLPLRRPNWRPLLRSWEVIRSGMGSFRWNIYIKWRYIMTFWILSRLWGRMV